MRDVRDVREERSGCAGRSGPQVGITSHGKCGTCGLCGNGSAAWFELRLSFADCVACADIGGGGLGRFGHDGFCGCRERDALGCECAKAALWLRLGCSRNNGCAQAALGLPRRTIDHTSYSYGEYIISVAAVTSVTSMQCRASVVSSIRTYLVTLSSFFQLSTMLFCGGWTSLFVRGD